MPMSKSIWLVSLASVLAVMVASAPAAAKQPKKPNIVVIFMKNLGYGELVIYGRGILRIVPTARIDGLVGEEAPSEYAV
jgi:hypothetical protein